MANHSQRAHAVLSASGSHRWLNCTPSARLEEQFPDTTSEAAKEGTLAHEICELKVAERLHDAYLGQALEKKRWHELYQPEMEEHTDGYVEFIKTEMMSFDYEPYMALEKRIDLTAYVPEGFGSVDCILIGGNTIEVIDFKYGKGVPVDAEYNPQMMLYALGAYEAYKALFKFDRVKMSIYQPRINNTNSWECSIEALTKWGLWAKAQAEIAFKGEGVFNPGDHCRFCRARASCRARADHSIKLAFEDGFGQRSALIDNSEIGRYLEMGRNVAKWVADLEEYALAECLSGRPVAGYKAVAGRTTRAWSDQDKAFSELIKSGTAEEMLYERKPLTVAKAEKLVGKKAFDEIANKYITKSEGKPTMVVESDKREAINTLEKIFD